MTDRYKAYPEYKDSGIEWLKEMPSHWELIRAKHLFQRVQRPVRPQDGIVTAFRDGEVTLRSNRRTDGFTNAAKEIGYQGVRKGDLLVHAMDGFAGAIGISDSDGKCSPVCSVCIPRKSHTIEPTYFGYLVRQLAVTDYITSLAKGIRERTTEFRFAEFASLFLAAPPKEEQQKIANFLDHETAKIDTLIAKQEKLIELLKEKRQAVISHAVTKGLPSVNGEADAPMKDSGVEWLGEVPEHWAVAPMKHFISDRKGAVKVGPFGSHLKNTDMLGEDVKVIAQKNVISKDISVGEAFISWEKYEELQAFTIEKGDLLITTRGTLGRTFIYDTDVLGILHPCLIRLQCNENKIKPELLALIIERSGYAMEQILVSSNSTTIEVIYSESLMNTVITLPKTLSEQCELLNYLEEQGAKFSKIIVNAQRSIALMEERKSALISAAVTGKIDVRDWNF